MKQVDSFYISKAWLGLKASIKARWKRNNIPCGYCGKPIDWTVKKGGKGPIADHIKDRRSHPELELEPTNIQIVHHRCNTNKARWHDNSDKVEIGEDGYPT